MAISIVVPTYYRSKDLAELFDSILRQTVKPMEVTVVDDTPTDAIETLCGKYRGKFKSKHIDLIFVKNPRGRSSSTARNVGVEKSRGDIIMFFDSDVILWPNYIGEILKVFQKYENAVGVQGYIIPQIITRNYVFGFLLNQLICRIFKISHFTNKNRYKWTEYPIALTEIINCERLCGSNMVVQRNIFKEVKFDENLKGYAYMEDFLFSYSIFKKYPHGLYMTPYAKCLHKASAEGKEKGKQWGFHLDYCRKYVLTKLFGWRGLLLYYWQSVGIMIIKLKGKIGDLLGFTIVSYMQSVT